MSAAGIRAGRAFVELGTNNDPLVRGLRAASAQLQAWGASVAAIGRRVFTAGAAIGAGLGAAVATWVNMGSSMLDASQRVGMSVEALSELKFAAEQSGASFEELENGIKFMQRGGFGRTAEDFQKIAEDIAAMPDPMMRTQRAMEVFGRAGTRLLPMAMDLARLRQEARDLGLVMSTQDAQAAESFGDTLSALWKSIKMGVFSIGAALGPALKMVSGLFFRGIAAIRAWIDRNRGLATVIAAVAVGLVGLGAALMVLGGLFSVMGTVLSVFAGVFAFTFGIVKAVMIATKVVALGMWAAITGPIGLIVAGLAAVGVAFFAFSENGRRAWSAITSGFQGMVSTVRTAWGGIMDALAVGDLQGAFQIALTGLHILWLQLVDMVKAAWNEFASWFSTTWLGQMISAINIFAARAELAAARVRAQQLDLDRENRLREIGLSPQEARRLRELQELDARVRENEAGAVQGAGIINAILPGILPTITQAQRDELNRLRQRQQEAERIAQEARPGPIAQIGQGVGPQQPLPGRPGEIAANPQIAALQRQLADQVLEASMNRELAAFNSMMEEMNRPGAFTGPAAPGLAAIAARADRVDVAGTFSAAAVAGLGASNLTELVEETNRLLAENNRLTAEASENAGVGIL